MGDHFENVHGTMYGSDPNFTTFLKMIYYMIMCWYCSFQLNLVPRKRKIVIGTGMEGPSYFEKL